MKPTTSPSLSRPLKRFFHRFHTTLFILVVLGGLVYATLLLASILNDASISEGYESPIQAGSIDQATLDRIDALHSSDEELPPPPRVEGRTNPFVE